MNWKILWETLNITSCIFTCKPNMNILTHIISLCMDQWSCDLCRQIGALIYFVSSSAYSSEWGAPTYYLSNFSRELHENEEILDQRGVHIPRAPLDPPLYRHLKSDCREMVERLKLTNVLKGLELLSPSTKNCGRTIYKDVCVGILVQVRNNCILSNIFMELLLKVVHQVIWSRQPDFVFVMRS